MRDHVTDVLRQKQHSCFTVAPGVMGMEIVFVNLFFVENPDKSWVLIDAGLYGSADRIRRAAEERFGKDNPPKAIILTHGHFDHVGALQTLADYWQAPVYAHPLELPYLTGVSSYPPPDSSVGGGAMAYLSFMYPKKPIKFRGRLEVLPSDGSVPFMPEWKWIETPGHSPGHVSLYRQHDRVLIVGDAFTTRKQESAMAVLTQKQEICGPPAYFTPDWNASRQSVQILASLEPEVAATGHGLPMSGEKLRQGLEELSRLFDQLAIPNKGRYVKQPAITNRTGVVSLPPRVNNTVPKILAAAGLAAIAGFATYSFFTRRNGGTNSRIKRTWPGKVKSTNRYLASVPSVEQTPVSAHNPNATTNNYP